MTPICDEHRALLRAVAKDIADEGAILAYSDWLQERQSPGWLIVANYNIVDWPVWMGGKTGWRQHHWMKGDCHENWKLPWLSGMIYFDHWVQQPRHRIKQILTKYANGEVV